MQPCSQPRPSTLQKIAVPILDLTSALVQLFATSFFSPTPVDILKPQPTAKMPPKKVYVERGLGSGRRVQKGYFRSAYDTLTSPENSGLVTAITVFGVCCRVACASCAHVCLWDII